MGACVMRGTYEQLSTEQTEIARRLRRGTDKIVGRKFGAVAKVLWPANTAAELASIAQTSTRTAERWMSGEFDPPICIVEAVIHETFK